jgi:hypothetical protein
MATQPALDDILKHPAVWRIGQMPVSTKSSIKTGFASLDGALPSHGWDQGALTEILANEQGIGELSVLIPALRQISQQGQGIVLVAPPYIPFPHAWEAHGIALKHVVIVRAEGQNLLWAIEQAARSGSCGMVIGWTASCRKELNYPTLRRLQVAADTGSTTLVLYRPANAAHDASAAPTRITATAIQGELQLQIIKRRAALMASPLRVNVFPAHWARRTVEHAKAALASRAANPHRPGELVSHPIPPAPRRLSVSR